MILDGFFNNAKYEIIIIMRKILMFSASNVKMVDIINENHILQDVQQAFNILCNSGFGVVLVKNEEKIWL